ncbi:winged helix DNA-binding domain-containing protein [Testicularia cyperi]|uniref:Winged helix DNA-binding domain-containing protein n=1 Tax=Testicularia cyperi TaxID=1882483 RepID=A0A317XIB6_9BASI|nr:winged helix DNA-binding domain-containing protein [Testicularia cyperi]
MRRHGPGIAALDRSLHSSSAYDTLGQDLSTSQITELRNQLELFSTALRQFAARHRQDIRKNPEFRHAFQKMCYSIGVDPLASAGPPGSGSAASSFAGSMMGGLWNDLLGLGDWQYELGVQIIDVCVSTRSSNGGIIAMDDLIRRLTKLRTGVDRIPSAAVSSSTNRQQTKRSGGGGGGQVADITEEDVARAIKSLAPLGCGYEVISMAAGGPKLVRSVPRELDTDTMTVLSLLLAAQTASPTTTTMDPRVQRDGGGLAYVTRDSLSSWNQGQSKGSSWSADRARSVLDNMCLREGMLWIDEAASPPRYFSLATLET